MKLDKLVKQIGRDAAANPKKAALLGVMALLALYFWAPLLGGWLVPSKRKPTPAGNLNLVLTDDPVEATDKTKAARGGNFRWEKVHQLIAGDSRMVSAEFDVSWSNPFASAAPREVVEAPEAPATASTTAAATPPPDLGPKEAGLVASCVMISPRRRTVMINDEVYTEQQTVRVPSKDDTAGGLEFRLVRIERQQITLERNGRTYTLELSKTGLADGDQIQRTPTQPKQ